MGEQDQSKKTKKAIVFFIFITALALLTVSVSILADPEVDVSSAIDTGLDTTQGVHLDWLDEESSIGERCLSITIDKEITSSDINIYVTDTDFNVLDVTTTSLEKEEDENYEVIDYTTRCSSTTVDVSNATVDTEVVETCEQIENTRTTESRKVWEDVSTKTSDVSSLDRLDTFTVSGKGTYKYCIDVPIVETEQGWGNKGTVYVEIDGQFYVDQQHSSWWNAYYSYRKEVHANTSSGSFDTVFLVNGTGNVLNQTCFVAGSLNISDSIVAYLYYNNETDYSFSNVVGNASIPFMCETGGKNLESNTKQLYADASFVYLLHEGSGTTTRDLVSGDNATFGNTPIWKFGHYGSALDFQEADTDYISFSKNISGVSGWTINAWVNREGTGNWDFIVDNNDCISLAFTDANQVYTLYDTNGGAPLDPVATPPGSSTGWHMVTARYDATNYNLTIWWDGVHIGGENASLEGANCASTSTIGIRSDIVHPFEGIIEQVEAYHVTKSDDWIKRQFELNRSHLSTQEQGQVTNDTISAAILSVLPDATLYSDQQVYVRYLNGTQMLGRFDWVAVYGSQRWAFNYVEAGETNHSMYDLPPSLYIWENASLTNNEVWSQVTDLISSTKV